MSGITFKISFILLLSAMSAGISGQDKATRYLKLTVGAGMGHFINTFKNVQDKDVVNNKPSFAAKLLWQPEYRLSIGIESGYYFIYTTHRIEVDKSNQTLTTDLAVVPMFLSISMQIFRHIEINMGSGWASMIYTVHPQKDPKDKITGHVYSFSNYTAGVSYLYPINSRIDLGTDLKYIYFGKTNDHHTSVLVTFSYKIVTKVIK